MSNKRTIIFSIIGVALFIVLIFSASYAFYSISVTKENEDNKTSSFTTKKINILFTDGAEINKSNIVPGDTFTKTFSITNNSANAYNFKIVMKDVENTFVNKDDVEIVLKEGTTPINTMAFPEATAVISGETALTLPADGLAHNYSLVITYKNTEEPQTDDMGKSISGKIFVEEVSE